MFPGLSPIYINPQSQQTNRPPTGREVGWSLAQSPNVTIPNIPGFFSATGIPFDAKHEQEKTEREEREKRERAATEGARAEKKEGNKKEGFLHHNRK